MTKFVIIIDKISPLILQSTFSFIWCTRLAMNRKDFDKLSLYQSQWDKLKWIVASVRVKLIGYALQGGHVSVTFFASFRLGVSQPLSSTHNKYARIISISQNNIDVTWKTEVWKWCNFERFLTSIFQPLQLYFFWVPLPAKACPNCFTLASVDTRFEPGNQIKNIFQMSAHMIHVLGLSICLCL